MRASSIVASLLLKLMAFAAVVGCNTSVAQDYPTKPLRMVIPFTAGGPTDLQGRLYADRLNSALHQPVVVENRPGAGGMIGAEAVTRAPADGYSLLLGSATTVYAPLVMPAPINPLKDLAPVALVSFIPLTLFAHADVPAKTLQELVAYGRSNPEKLNLGVASFGGSDHLAGELLNARAGTKVLTVVPYKGAAPILQDLVTGRIELIITTLAAVRDHVDSGKVRALAGIQSTRSPFLPAVPTIAESYPGYDVPTWNAVWTTPGTPAGIVARLTAEFQALLQNQEVIAKLRGLSYVPMYGNAAQLAAKMHDDYERIAKLVRDAGIKAQ